MEITDKCNQIGSFPLEKNGCGSGVPSLDNFSKYSFCCAKKMKMCSRWKFMAWTEKDASNTTWKGQFGSVRGQLVGGDDCPQAFRQQLPTGWGGLSLCLSCPHDPTLKCPSMLFHRKSQSAFLRNEGTQLSFQSHQNLLVLMSLKSFLKWLLAWTCSQFVKGFPLFSLCYVEAPSTPQKTTCKGQPCFKVRCKFSEWFSSGPLHYPHMSIG